MIKKIKNTTDQNDDDKFVEILDNDDTDTDSEDTQNDDSNEELNKMLSKPEEALKMVEAESDENEEVLYCPHCGLTGLFVDNVCTNCGEKKSKKSSRRQDDNDDMTSFGDDDGLVLEEF